jgi:hypothetical protein
LALGILVLEIEVEIGVDMDEKTNGMIKCGKAEDQRREISSNCTPFSFSYPEQPKIPNINDFLHFIFLSELNVGQTFFHLHKRVS